MTNDKLKQLIYNQLYAASVYELLISISPDTRTQTTIKNLKADTLNNASYLERYYQELNTSSYNPIVEEPIIVGSFIKTVLWMQNYASNSSRLFFEESFKKENEEELREQLNYISSILNNHSSVLTHIYLNN